MHGLGVGGGGEVGPAGAEGEAGDADAALDAAAELVQALALGHAEHADHGPALRRRGQPPPAHRPRQRRQRAVVRADHALRVLEHAV